MPTMRVHSFWCVAGARKATRIQFQSAGTAHRTMRKIVLLIILLFNSTLPALSQMKYHIQWEDQFNRWQHYQTQHHLPSAVRTAKNRYKSSGKRQRVVDDNGNLMDIIQ